MGVVGYALFPYPAQDHHALDDGVDCSYHLDYVARSDGRDVYLVYRSRFYLERVDPCAHGCPHTNGRACLSSLQTTQATKTIQALRNVVEAVANFVLSDSTVAAGPFCAHKMPQRSPVCRVHVFRRLRA